MRDPADDPFPPSSVPSEVEGRFCCGAASCLDCARDEWLFRTRPVMLEIAVEADEEWDSSRSWEELARRAADAAIAESAFPQLAESGRTIELSVRLTSDEQVSALNAHWRGKHGPTNVLSFPMASENELRDESFAGQELLLGDIILARGVCGAEAADKGVALETHASHLIVHGTLHLLGYDHMDERDAADMEEREIRALSRLGIANPYEAAA